MALERRIRTRQTQTVCLCAHYAHCSVSRCVHSTFWACVCAAARTRENVSMMRITFFFLQEMNFILLGWVQYRANYVYVCVALNVRRRVHIQRGGDTVWINKRVMNYLLSTLTVNERKTAISTSNQKESTNESCQETAFKPAHMHTKEVNSNTTTSLISDHFDCRKLTR